MQNAYRYRLYPTDEQGQQMTRTIGCCRFVWNRLLEYCSKSYTRRKESHTAFDLNNFIAHTLRSMASENEEKAHGYSMEAFRLA